MNEETTTNAGTSRPDPPEVRVFRATQVPDGDGGRRVWLLTIICPHCGRKHTHGGGGDALPGRAGHRVSHCMPGVPGRDLGYTLVFDDLTDIIPIRRATKQAAKRRVKQAPR